jgi:hypothetical protein
VAERDGALRLVSPLYGAEWPPRAELVAVCRRGSQSALFPPWPGRQQHASPASRCCCGIYATRTAAQAASYLTRFFKERGTVLHRLLGTVALWGTVVECELGWRGSHAYPTRIYLPLPRKPRLSLFTGLGRPMLPLEDIALGLAGYGVPVEIVEATTIGELSERLDPRPSRTGSDAATAFGD